jgi:hypothetical protein
MPFQPGSKQIFVFGNYMNGYPGPGIPLPDRETGLMIADNDHQSEIITPIDGERGKTR